MRPRGATCGYLSNVVSGSTASHPEITALLGGAMGGGNQLDQSENVGQGTRRVSRVGVDRSRRKLHDILVVF